MRRTVTREKRDKKKRIALCVSGPPLSLSLPPSLPLFLFSLRLLFLSPNSPSLFLSRRKTDPIRNNFPHPPEGSPPASVPCPAGQKKGSKRIKKLKN